ncbi:hypothetical protein E2C06_34095 [Dankookia rubra]|uniref:Uncharacterized protein n=1 Tax=Dankookia rubra TaxID=1442381 RepID=A0A4R5Q6H1_9PROT|nr:hypothetical protein [Dankookia rubra]TDH58143.1 hypothetical protein E2C06_34095 [Dankookia rubra]
MQLWEMGAARQYRASGTQQTSHRLLAGEDPGDGPPLRQAADTLHAEGALRVGWAEIQRNYRDMASIVQRQQRARFPSPLAITSKERSPLLPEVPTTNSVHPELEITSWGGL